MTWALRVLREPLLHFLLIGAAVFGAYHLLSPAEAPEDPAGIVITPERAQQIVRQFEVSLGRTPSDEERQGLIEAYIHEEVLVREALALSLDQNDPVIRQRLAEKMVFLISSEAQAVSPAEQDLRMFYQENADDYEVERQLAFEQIFLGPAATDERVAAARAALAEGVDPAEIGESTLLPFAQPLANETRIDETFGPGVFALLVALPEGAWGGPVTSAYGDHLVRITDNVPSFVPALDDIKDIVTRDWRISMSEDIIAERIEQLVARYGVARADLEAE